MDTKLFGQKDERIAYKEQGQGQAVVLLHGFCGSSSYWDKLLPLLPAHYRYIAPDLRGHGHSGAPAGDFSMEAFADDLARLLEHLEEKQVIVLGHSLGGYVTLALAERAKGEDSIAPLAKLPHVMFFGGGVVIKLGDEVIGSIGAAGAPGAKLDDGCAHTGLDKIRDQLK